jgi:ubiquinone/menaquinone biosynthesis C-methylase UbiE
LSDTRKKFDDAAATWDEEPRRVKLAEEIASAMLREIEITPDMDVLDYGCGTGLITLCLQPHVRRITGADISNGMLDALREKVRMLSVTNVNTVSLDPGKNIPVTGRFHLVVSSMTLHHVPDVGSLLKEFNRLLLPGGMLALADLDAEDGSFHGDTIPAAHAGFDRGAMQDMLRAVGFRDIRDTTAAVVEKGTATGETRRYPVFLMVALK